MARTPRNGAARAAATEAINPTNPTAAEARSLKTKSRARTTSTTPTASHTVLLARDAIGATVPVVRVTVCSLLPLGPTRVTVSSRSLTSGSLMISISGDSSRPAGSQWQ